MAIKSKKKSIKQAINTENATDHDDYISLLFGSEGIVAPFLCIAVFGLLVRLAVSLHSYSGAGNPPKFGDYEAQRHWMEITTNLPAKEWYCNSTSNDLAYWGLDYPPLTAYQSYVHGLLLRYFDPDSVALFTSRGYESYLGKLLMRWTVLSSDALIFFPAALYFVLAYYGSRPSGLKSNVIWHIALILINPCLVLIDHGHFQYNCISLGFTLAAIAAILSRKDLVASVFFSLALNHKQMSAYFAPAFFSYLLGNCLRQKNPVLEVLKLGFVVIGTFALIWWPYLHSTDGVLGVLSRLAPFERGLYEDYVANFWCTTSVIIKWKRLFTTQWQAEAPTAGNNVTSAFASPAPSTKGRHFLVICCENKAIFLDLVTMRGRDVPKQELDNKSLLCMEFLCRSSDGPPLVAFGGSDGVIRVLSMLTWKLVRRYTGGHKGSISCLMTFMASSGEALLVSGGSDGLLVLWSADHGQDSRELVPKLSLKAHDGGVVAVELSRVIGGAPQLITIGADKTLAIWDTISFKELRRIKPVPKSACHSVASWCHPRAPNLDILTCVKDSHIWAIEHPTYSALTRPLCELSSLIPPHVLAPNKKLRVYCMAAHSLQPHLVVTGTNIGLIVCEFDTKSLPAVAPLPTPSENREHSAVYVVERELKLLNFQLSNTANPSLASNGSLSETGKYKGDTAESLHVKQMKKHISTPVPHDSYSVLSVSGSGKYLAIVWPDIPYFSVYKVSDWSIVDSGSARLLAWDTCRDRFAILESALPPRMPIIPKGGSSRKAKEAAAAAAQAAAAAASAASSATVQVRILLDDGTSNILMRSIGGRSEPVIGLHGGALLGVAYRTSRRVSPVAATAISTIQSMPLSGFGSSSISSFTTMDDGFSSHRSPAEAAPPNFQLYSWETFQPVGNLLPQPEWTAWDQTVEYCAFAYQRYIVISSLRPQYRYLGDVAIPYATGAVWHRRQLFVVTPTTIECVFVDAGVAAIDLETRRMKEEMKMKEAQARAVAEHGELALITVDGPQTTTQEKIKLRPPMLQVVRLASFQHAPSVPPFLTLPKQAKVDGDAAVLRDMEEKKVNEIAVGGGGVSVAVTRFPGEQKRPVGPLVVVGVRDGVLWLIDRYMCAHALSLSHPGIRCRCLAAYGDAVSAVKWAIRLGREHHDDLAQFMLGMGYATEALHLPGISKRLEFDLAIQSSDLKRALQCLLTMSNSREIGQDGLGLDMNDILNLTAKKENIVEAVQGIVKFAKEFLDLIDAADATAQADIAREALKRLAAAGSVKGALQGHELRGLALRLANHGELTRLSGLVNNLISVGSGREAAFAAAVLGDNALMEKAWQDTGMLAEAVLHSHAHGRPTLKNLVEAWNKMLQKEVEHAPPTKTDAAAAFLASLEEPKLTSLAEAGKKPPIEILPPGMPSLSALITSQKKPALGTQTQQQPGKMLQLEAPPPATPELVAAATTSTATTTTADSTSTTATTNTVASAPETEPVLSTTPEASSSQHPPEASNSQHPPEADGAALEDKATIPSSKSNPDLGASGESGPATSASSETLEGVPAPQQIPENQVKNIPSTMPMSDAVLDNQVKNIPSTLPLSDAMFE